MKALLAAIIAAILGFFHLNTVGTPISIVPTPTVLEGQVISINGLTFTTPQNFGLAITSQQMPQNTVIPACDSGFDYCLYFLPSNYAGTNLESAGVRVQKRNEFTTQSACLNTVPDGYVNLTPTIHTTAGYATSVMTPIQDAGAGHYAVGEIDRLSFNNICYEFETRIAATQFANYPDGAIKEFTKSDQQNLSDQLQQILKQIRLNSNLNEAIF